MLIGMIMYISIFKAEIGSKMRPKSPLQPPLFTFSYGQSFVLYVIGFVLTEIVGVLNVYLFIGLQQVRLADRRLAAANGVARQSNHHRHQEEHQLGQQASSMQRGKHQQQQMVPPGGYYSPMTQNRYNVAVNQEF